VFVKDDRFMFQITIVLFLHTVVDIGLTRSFFFIGVLVKNDTFMFQIIIVLFLHTKVL
jgi:hypothetical protein